MPPTTQLVNFDGDLLVRGFWLYVWEVTSPEGGRLYYVGRTGDSSSINAQSPFNRMSQHLGFAENSNQLRRHLQSHAFQPEECSFRLIAHGPVLAEATTREEHRTSRDVAAALEKALADAMLDSGYQVMNRVNCRMPKKQDLFDGVRAAFAAHFPALQTVGDAARGDAMEARS